MKKNQIKLNQFCKAELEQRAMNQLRGGSNSCGCASLSPLQRVIREDRQGVPGYDEADD
ncbi:MAG: TIGR04149 family rSAM-modified RiPP [Bacteroidales bacterium]|nr:TIGR04149 family rSAM-modified RiPP [Bacteroidales bacterium]